MEAFLLSENSNGFRLDGKVAVITGGASGIGRAIAQKFACSGATIRIVDLDENASDTVVGEIAKCGGDAKAYRCDVSSQDDVKAVFGRILEQGPISILVNNAGISHVGSLERTSERDFDKGLVLVNPSTSSVTVTLPSMMRQAQPSGGGQTGDARQENSGSHPPM